MGWGWLSHGRDDSSPTGGCDTVFFEGHDGSDLVMLAGSRRHVLGEPASDDARIFASALPNILAVIANHIIANHITGAPGLGQRYGYLRRLPPAERQGLPLAERWSDEFLAVQDPPEKGLQAAANVDIHWATQYVEFLAVPLIQGEAWTSHPDKNGFVRPFRAVLATPIYGKRGQEGPARRPRPHRKPAPPVDRPRAAALDRRYRPAPP